MVGTAPSTSNGADSQSTERALLGASALSALGSGLTVPFVLVYLAEVVELGITRATLVLAIPGLAVVAAVILTGPTIDAVGARSFGAAVSAVAASGALLLAIAGPSMAGVAIAGALAVELGMGAFAPAFQAQIGASIPAERHARFFSVQAGMANACLGLGGVGSSIVIASRGLEWMHWLFLIDAASFLGLGFFVARIPGPTPRSAVATKSKVAEIASKPTPQGSARLLLVARRYLWDLAAPVSDKRFLRALSLTFLLTAIGLAQFDFAYPAYLATQFTALIGLGYATNAVAGALFQLGAAKFLSGRSHLRVSTLAAVVWALSWICLMLTRSGGMAAAGAVLAFAMLFGLAEALVIAVVPAFVLSAADPDRLGAYMSWNSIVFQSGRVVAPLLVAPVTAFNAHLLPVAFAAFSLMLIPATRLARPVVIRDMKPRGAE